MLFPSTRLFAIEDCSAVEAPSGMQVHRYALATAGKITLGCMVLLAFAALAVVGANLGLSLRSDALKSAAPPAAMLSSETSASSEISASEDPAASADAAPADAVPAATPAEVLAARFPEDALSRPLMFSASSMVPDGRGEAYDLAALSGFAAVEPPWPSANGVAPSAAVPETQDQPAEPKFHRPSARSPNVLNDAQIASIKQRLKLTAAQAQLWPPVEAALRKVVYTRTAMNPKGGGSAYIDPSSPEVRELKSAALPLLIRLNDEQKREVRMLAYVMGLEAVASQF